MVHSIHAIWTSLSQNMGLPRWLSCKKSAWQCRRLRRCRFDSWVGKIPWRRKWQSTPVFLPGKSCGQRSLAGYSPWGHKELDMTEQQSTRAHTHTHTHTHTHKSEYRGLFLKLSFVNLDIVFSDVRSLIYEVYILYISLSIYCHSIIYILHYMPIFYCCIHRYYQGNIFINYSRLVIYCVTFSRP